MQRPFYARIHTLVAPAALLAAFLCFLPGHASAATQIFLTDTASSSWPVPSDWNNASNTIEVIGAGGRSIGKNGCGGGGGAYSKISNLSLTPGGSAAYQVGDGTVSATTSSSRDTWFSSTGTLLAKGGTGGGPYITNCFGTGGSAASGVGTTKYSGGAGVYSSPGGSEDEGGAGGGAAGLNGNGNDAWNDVGLMYGGAGDAGFGGASTTGAANIGTEWDASHGSGSGGGYGDPGAPGGQYGGGASGNADGSHGGPSGLVAGGGGLIVITYTPAPLSCTLTATPSTIAQGATAGLAWTTTSATSASLDNGIGSVSIGSGSATTTATTTTTYTMTVSGPSGSDTCSATVTFDNDKIVFRDSGSSWTVPDDWNNASNTVEVIGAGGPQTASYNPGGGAYSKKNNISLTPGDSVSYQIGVPTDGFANDPSVDTWFVSSTTVRAAGSTGNSNGGQASNGVGDVKYSGGDAGFSGGGAAGPNGDGEDGSSITDDGGAGDAGYGGAGGIAAAGTQAGRNGGNGTEWDALHGAGGGGAYGEPGGCGGLYGGGGSPSPEGQGCPGANGLVVITYTPLTTPGTPGTPTFSNTTATSTTVSWSTAAGASTYKVERCTTTGCSSYTEIASGVSGTSYDDTGTLTGNTTYGYRVRATNTYGDGSYSSGAEVTTLPNVPGTPSFSSTTSTGTTVSWSAPTGGASTYKVERCTGTGCSSYSQIAGSVSGTSYNDTGTLSPSTTYRYRVRGTNTTGDGLYSAGAEVTTNANAATCTLSASPSGIIPGGSSTLSWTTTDASSASIDNGIGSVSTGSGSTSVTPSATTLYTLTVSGTGGGGSCTATVGVSRSAATFFGGHVLISGSHIYIR